MIAQVTDCPQLMVKALYCVYSMQVTSYNLFDVKTKILFRLYRVTCTYVAVQTLYKYTCVHFNAVGYE